MTLGCRSGPGIPELRYSVDFCGPRNEMLLLTRGLKYLDRLEPNQLVLFFSLKAREIGVELKAAEFPEI